MASRFKKRREARRKREQQKIEERAKHLGYVEKRGFDKSSPVSVVLPYSDTGCEYRRASFEFIKNKWKETYPDWEVVVGECPTTEWRKGLAISDGLEKASGEIVIVADTDGWVDNVHETLDKLNDFVVVKPFLSTARFSDKYTNLVLKHKVNIEEVDVNEPNVCVSKPGEFISALGGMVVSHKEVLEKIPVDPRFYNWGWEDNAWTHAVTCLAGPIYYAPGVFKHLWHPRNNDNPGKTNSILCSMYRKARISPEETINLIQEGLDWRSKNVIQGQCNPHHTVRF